MAPGEEAGLAAAIEARIRQEFEARANRAEARVRQAEERAKQEVKQAEARTLELAEKLKHAEQAAQRKGKGNAEGMPDELCCPITCELMVDPVIASNGQTYERKAIDAWLKDKDTDPMTGDKLADKTVRPNVFARGMCRDYKGATF